MYLCVYSSNEFKEIPIVMGEFQGKYGETGHLTTGGVFAGGSGYVLGRKTLERLVEKKVRFAANKYEDIGELLCIYISIFVASNFIYLYLCIYLSMHLCVYASTGDSDEYRSRDQIKGLSVGMVLYLSIYLSI
jgi:hypothetical protein